MSQQEQVTQIEYEMKFLIDTDKPAQDASLLLQWCIMPEALAQIREQEIKDPYLLLTVVDNYGTERRVLLLHGPVGSAGSPTHLRPGYRAHTTGTPASRIR